MDSRRAAPANSPTRPAQLKARDLEEKSILLRKAGHTFEAIGRALNVSAMGAHKAVTRALERQRKELVEEVEDLRQMEVARLDEMLNAIYIQAKQGDMDAIDRVLKIGERRAKLLGIEKPIRVAVSPDHGDIDAQIDRLFTRMAEVADRGEIQASLEADGPPKPINPAG